MKKKKNIILKDLDGWVEVFIFDPLTLPLVKPLSKISTNPLFYTVISILITLLATYFIIKQNFVVAGILYFFSIVTDGVDGKIGRYNNRNIIIHGVLDVMTDQMRNAVYLVALFIVVPHARFLIFLLILLHLTYEFTYAIRLELKTRHFEDQPRGYSLKKLKSYYENEIITANRHLKIPIDIYNHLFNFSSKFRTYPFPTIVDAEFLFLVVFVITQNLLFGIIALVFIFPDLLMSIFLTLTLAMRLQKANE